MFENSSIVKALHLSSSFEWTEFRRFLNIGESVQQRKKNTCIAWNSHEEMIFHESLRVGVGWTDDGFVRECSRAHTHIRDMEWDRVGQPHENRLCVEIKCNTVYAFFIARYCSLFHRAYDLQERYTGHMMRFK